MARQSIWNDQTVRRICNDREIVCNILESVRQRIRDLIIRYDSLYWWRKSRTPNVLRRQQNEQMRDRAASPDNLWLTYSDTHHCYNVTHPRMISRRHCSRAGIHTSSSRSSWYTCRSPDRSRPLTWRTRPCLHIREINKQNYNDWF